MSTRAPVLSVEGLCKTFIVHLQGGAELGVIRNASFSVGAGECVVLGGPSGVGKSSILKMVFGNYRADSGAILVRAGEGVTDVARASPREVLALRRSTVGYVSQFLRVIPRVGARDIIAAAARADGADTAQAAERAATLLGRLNLPPRLWPLPPATFSGGEQQRVNIARGFCAERRLLLLDEPTASLDGRNREVVIELVRERKRAGVAILAIFHDQEVRDALADRVIDVADFAPRAA
jgi:alpha-D-ribose 1-methylphosphonate 5-triphosphate synthase subunit PhnL